MHPWVLYLDLNIPVGMLVHTAYNPSLGSDAFHSIWCPKVCCCPVGRHHSAAQGRGSSWSGLQFHQRGGIPWAGWKWTAAGERHLWWYVSTQTQLYTITEGGYTVGGFIWWKFFLRLMLLSCPSVLRTSVRSLFWTRYLKNTLRDFVHTLHKCPLCLNDELSTFWRSELLSHRLQTKKIYFYVKTLKYCITTI